MPRKQIRPKALKSPIKNRSKISQCMPASKYLTNKNLLLQSLMDSIPDVIYFKDRKGRLVLVNRAHAKGLGLEPEQVVGKTDFDFFPKERAKAMAKDDEYVIRTGKPIIDKIERATRADGVDNYVSTTKAPNFDSKGRVIGLIGITRDITHRIHLEKEREARVAWEKESKSLKEMNKIKSDFISIVSHELRTPMTIIKEFASQLADELVGPVNPEQREIVSIIKGNTERLNRMIEDLLDLSRIESGKFKLRYSLINLNELIKSSSEFFSNIINNKDIKLDYSLPDESVNIFIDAERINQVISNLIGNALKFTESGGRIKVELKVVDDRIRIGIFDTGIGIAKTDILKLFNRFAQVSKVGHLDKKGLGLGLSICKDIVEKHKGEIWAESKLGVGSKFYFTLPLYYTVKTLDKQAMAEINKFLDKDVPVHLVNLVVLNYKEFNARVKLDSEKLLTDIRRVITDCLDDFSSKGSDKPHLIMSGLKRGECSIIFPGVNDDTTKNLCDDLKIKINAYLSNYKNENVFIAMGVMSYVDKTDMERKTHVGNLEVKEIYIGAEMRRHKRYPYTAKVDITHKGGTGDGQTVDLSESGICFLYKEQLVTDSIVGVVLHIPIDKKKIELRGRVAWVRKITEAMDQDNFYKIGLEFTNGKENERAILCNFLKKL